MVQKLWFLQFLTDGTGTSGGFFGSWWNRIWLFCWEVDTSLCAWLCYMNMVVIPLSLKHWRNRGSWVSPMPTRVCVFCHSGHLRKTHSEQQHSCTLEWQWECVMMKKIFLQSGISWPMRRNFCKRNFVQKLILPMPFLGWKFLFPLIEVNKICLQNMVMWGIKLYVTVQLRD